MIIQKQSYSQIRIRLMEDTMDKRMAQKQPTAMLMESLITKGAAPMAMILEISLALPI